MTNAASAKSIELFEDESVVAFGTSETTWFIRVNDAWVHISQWPGAASERLDAKPGMVWLKRTELSAPAGTRFMRVESRPMRKARKSPLDYLQQPSGAKRQTLRHYFVLTRSGSLERK